jgi:hypothetical protein
MVEKFRILGTEVSIDLDLIEQMVTNNAFGYQELGDTLDAILFRLTVIQAPADDESTARLTETVLAIVRLKLPMHDILTFCFSSVTEKLDKIAASIVLLASET